ncbi:serine/threonine-protein kinase [Streptosporangium subroseum]|uniref:serine/threonine-protein kinase n=1 Tax=Streptosporangium subroseum TaxID=106412 RepID=UPI0030914454|nr:protein kinase [Streptosporangium subroseum]
MNNLSPGEFPQIGRYRVLSQLGRGGMGTVYLGESADGQQVAIKVINPEYSQHEQFRMRFRREADAAQRVRRFCTAAVIEAALDGDQLYVVTEYVTGPNLEEAVRAQGPLRGSSLDALAVGVATALTAIHSAGVVHRDLKPSNVLLSPIGPRVIDFGIARALDTLSGITGTGEIIGTPRYMAPEVLRGEPVSPACDVFSWGCLVAFAASGRPPFGGEALPAVLYQVLNTEPALENMEPALRELVTYAIAKDPSHRPTSQQLLDHLVGRSAAPEQTAYSVQAAWQQSPSMQGPSPQRPSVQGPSTQRPAAQTTPAAHETVPWAETAASAGPSTGLNSGPGPDRTAPASPRAGRAAGQRKILIGAAVAALIAVGGGLGLYLALSPGGPPEDLALLYQDDFTQSGTGWTGGPYDPAVDRYGYASEGYYALDVNGEYALLREEAPTGFVSAPPATPNPTASPTPITPARLLLGVDVGIRSGSTGPGEYGLFCRGKDDTKATRYEFLLDTAGNARIRKSVESAGGELTKPVPVDLPKDQTTRLQAECSGDADGVQLTMWVNGGRVQSVRDTNPLPSGEVGMIARVGEKSKAVLKASFDNFTMHGPLSAKKP